MKSSIYAAIAGAVLSAITGCDVAEPVTAVTDAIASLGQQPAEAYSLGFDPSQPYPSRNHEYDKYLQPSSGLSQWQLDKLFNHVAMPQSHSAMVGLLGYPTAEQGDVLYWAIEGGSSELAVTYNGVLAVSYTVGY